MATNALRFRCSPDDVMRVLANGWVYAVWVVGASRMREVDAEWPSPGSQLHHSVGIWPFVLNDRTVCLEWDPPRRMTLRARGWPVGEARVEITVRPDGDGSIVRMTEFGSDGPAGMMPRPLQDAVLRPRNRESLRRLRYLAEGSAAPEGVYDAEQRES